MPSTQQIHPPPTPSVRRHHLGPRDRAKADRRDLIARRKWERDNRHWWGGPEPLAGKRVGRMHAVALGTCASSFI